MQVALGALRASALLPDPLLIQAGGSAALVVAGCVYSLRKHLDADGETYIPTVPKGG